MKHRRFTFMFNGGQITVRAFNEQQAEILAQAEAIRKGWNYKILSKEEVEMAKYTVETHFETDDRKEVEDFAFECHRKGYNTKFTDNETGEVYADYDTALLQDLILEQREQM